MAYSIRAAIESELFSEVVVSTDTDEYANIAKQYGASVPFLRSQKNSSDTATSYDLICEVLERYKKIGRTFDTFCLLQPTSPLRDAQDIKAAYSIYETKLATSVISVCEVDYSPAICNTLPADGCMSGFLDLSSQHKGRQKLDTTFRINGAIYISNCDLYIKTSHFY